MMDWLLRHWKVNLALMVLLLAGGVAAVVNDIAQSPSDQHSAAIWSAVLGGWRASFSHSLRSGRTCCLLRTGSPETQTVSDETPGRV